MADATDDTAAAPKLTPFVQGLADQGFPVDEHGLPYNLRLRAEALADAGQAEDPAGSVTADTIAETGERVAAEAAEAEAAQAAAAKAAPSLKWSEKDLRAEAERRGAVVESDANKPAILAAINAAPAAGQEG